MRLDTPVVAQTEVLGSRFIAYLTPISSVAEARDHLETVRLEHPEASHHCWAYLLGSEMRFSDDGEPGGTAGRPMLEVIIKRELDRCSAVVVRYFGGRKLGAGGLVRAYSGAVSHALDVGSVSEFVPRTRVLVRAPFAHADAVLRLLPGVTAGFDAAGLLVNTEVDDSALEPLRVRLRDASRGAATLEALGSVVG